MYPTNSKPNPELRKTVGKHKEEGTMRQKLDNKDRDLMLERLQSCSHPLNTSSTQLYNIVTGQVAPPEINAHNECTRD